MIYDGNTWISLGAWWVDDISVIGWCQHPPGASFGHGTPEKELTDQSWNLRVKDVCLDVRCITVNRFK